jgi:hypothetical protein
MSEPWRSWRRTSQPGMSRETRPNSPLQNRMKMRQTGETWKKTRKTIKKYRIQPGSRSREEKRRNWKVNRF